MPTLKDAAAATQELVDLATKLHEEIVDGDVEFERMVELADAIGERADALAEAFSDVNDRFSAQLSADGSGSDES